MKVHLQKLGVTTLAIVAIIFGVATAQQYNPTVEYNSLSVQASSFSPPPEIALNDFTPEQVAQGVVLPKDSHNFFRCETGGDVATTVNNLWDVRLWAYEFTGNEPPFDGDFFISEGELAVNSQYDSTNTLQTFKEGNRYYVMSTVDLPYKCGEGLSLVSYCGDDICQEDIEYVQSCPEDCSVCGDGYLGEGVEECDDNNTINSDGCNSECFVEDGYRCSYTYGQGSECTPLIPSLSGGVGTSSSYPTSSHPNSSYPSSSSSSSPSGTADLSVDSTVVTPIMPRNGDTFTIRQFISNAGPDALTNFLLQAIIPNGLEFIASSSTQGCIQKSTHRVECTTFQDIFDLTYRIPSDSCPNPLTYDVYVSANENDPIDINNTRMKLISILCSSSSSSSSSVVPGNGDFDGNGVVDILDAFGLIDHLQGGPALSDEQFARVDMNGDGAVNETDADLLIEKLGGESDDDEEQCPPCAAPPEGCEGTGQGACGCGPYVNPDGSMCTAPAPDSVDLHSASLNENNDLTIAYSKNFDTCAHIYTRSGYFDQRINFICSKGNNLEAEANQSSFNDTLSVGDEIKICHGNNGNLCSGFVTITDPATGHGS